MKKLLTGAIAFFTICTSVYGQQKYGHVNSLEILAQMPEYKQMQASLEKKKKEYESRLNIMYTDYEKKQKELSQVGFGLMEAVREEKMMELEKLAQSIQSYEEKIDSDLQSLQQKLMKPLNDKYLKVMDAVATENGYTFIFDIASGILAYFPENEGDVSPLVKKKMGIN